MEQLKPITKTFYGLGIAGIGSLQFVYPHFRPVIAPIPAEDTNDIKFLIYLTGALLVAAGLFIAFARNVKAVACYLAIFLLLFLLFAHLPNRLTNFPNILGAWTGALKLFALAGGALMISLIFPGGERNIIITIAEKIAPYGKYFFALMLVIFGIDHFLYVDFVKSLVPLWIPGNLFWTYFAAVALIGAGVAIFINFKPRLISLLLAAMLFLWLILLHIPRAIVATHSDNGNEWTSVCQCLAFTGLALLYPFAGISRKAEKIR